MKADVILIAGPTASGKSALALDLAVRCGGVILNADSMQVYSLPCVLTARPQARELVRVPHGLYGMVAPEKRYSTGKWLEAAEREFRMARNAGKTAIFVGGTGLYFQALTDGFIHVPAVPEGIVRRIEDEVAPMSRAERGALLLRRDPEMAKVLLEPDRQRVVRALSVLEATGQSLVRWKNECQKGVLEGCDVEKIVLNPDRGALASRIKSRFEHMLENGAVEEVRVLDRMGLDPRLPVMKAIGVREIRDWMCGLSSREAAVERAVTATRQYAKRQRTWFRRRMAHWKWRE